MNPKAHWEGVYGSKAPDAVSWYEPHLEHSLAYIRRTGLPNSAAVIDVGGGEATLVDDLLEDGFQNVTVLDISSKALDVCKERLGKRAAAVKWMVSDVLNARLPVHGWDVWHDRAVFHFLTEEGHRRRYVDQVVRALRPGGFAIVGAFGPEGPTECSGLPVARYGAEQLHAEFGGRFTLVEKSVQVHTTPWGAPQQFVYCFCRLEH